MYAALIGIISFLHKSGGKASSGTQTSVHVLTCFSTNSFASLSHMAQFISQILFHWKNFTPCVY